MEVVQVLGFLLRFVKGGNKFAIVGGCPLSQGMMGVRWPREERKPNMVELVVHVVFDERKRSNQERFPYRQRIFKVTFAAE